MNHALEVGEVVALVLALESFKTLGGDAEQVGDGEADAAGADIEAQNAAPGGWAILLVAGSRKLPGRPGRVGRHGLDYKRQRKSPPFDKLRAAVLPPRRSFAPRTAGGGCPYIL